MREIETIAQNFQFRGNLREVDEIKSGNINTTYRVKYDLDGATHQYTLQSINTEVFKEPRNVMHNIQKVTQHLRNKRLEAKGDVDRGVLQLVPTTKGEFLHITDDGKFWRAYGYIDGVRAYDQVEHPQHFFEAGFAFGQFQRFLSDFNASELHDTIPNFHNTSMRVKAFRDAVAADAGGRVASIAPEIEFTLERAERAGRIVSLLESGELQLRVTHNDTKINNVLLDEYTGKAVCVIDLDTVMSGSSLYDYGDAIRCGASTAAEDEPDTAKIHLDVGLAEQFTRGFLEGVNGNLPSAEIRMLPLGIWTITYELGMRFLTDYINGDKYFRIHSKEHNLVRARAQQALLLDIERKERELQLLIDELLAVKV